MRRIIGLFSLSILTACSQQPADGGPGQASNDSGLDNRATTPSAWQSLFAGSSLAAFRLNGDANWVFDADTVGADSGNGMLVTNQTFADFELQLEFWVDEPANSGVFIRCPDPSSITDTTCYEANIFDTRPDQTYRTGAIVNVASPAVQIDAADRWNSYGIRAQGQRLQIVLNGETVVDVEDGQFAAGHIGLQYGMGVVKFRNVRIRTL